MAYIKNENGTFTVKGKSGKDWIVSEQISNCSCPKFKFMLKGQSPCHHMTEVEIGEAKVTEAVEKASGVNTFAKFDKSKYLQPMFLHEFIKVFGESQYRVLSATAEIFTQRGYVRLI